MNTNDSMSTDYHTALLPPPASADISSGTREDRVKKVAMILAPLAFIGILGGGYATGAFDIFSDAAPQQSASESDPALGQSELSDTPLITRELIEHIKSKTQSWEPVDMDDFHPYKDWTLSQMRKLQRKSPLDFDYVPDPRNINDGSSRHPAPLKVPNNGNYGDLPKEFDARVKWPNCQSIHIVRDQGSCGSCWAFGSVSAMSDRVCIHSNGTFQHLLSHHDLMVCNRAVNSCCMVSPLCPKSNILGSKLMSDCGLCNLFTGLLRILLGRWSGLRGW